MNLYSKDYFKLQLEFAEKVAGILGEPIEKVLLQYTSFYKTFRIEGWDFDSENETWKEFIKNFSDSENKLDAVYEFYLKHNREKEDHKYFGCFSYEYEKEEQYIQVHFRNNDDPEPGALSRDRILVRKNELKEMFEEIRQKYPEAKTVVGFSWLYNIPAYLRLFPEEYIHNAKVVSGWFKTGALWGQFLDSAGDLRQDMAARFRECIKDKTKIEELDQCFEYRVLEPEIDIDIFYKFYGIYIFGNIR